MTYVLMDVGGTQIKAQAFNSSGYFSGEMKIFDAKSGSGKREIFENFAEIINSLLLELPASEKKLSGVGMAFPGPFDYENGISLMHGLGKYDAIYGCSVRQEIKNSHPLLITDDVPFVFLHDTEAFAIGEIHNGAAAQSHRAIHLCIGTGAGSAFTENGCVLKEPTEIMPPDGWIYNTVFRNSIIDDYVSVRGLRKISSSFFEAVPDGADLFSLCNQGDLRAMAVFSEFGETVCEALDPFLRSFKPDTLILGGQISKSFCWFGKALETLCKELGIIIVISINTSEMILRGLLSVLTELSTHNIKTVNERSETDGT